MRRRTYGEDMAAEPSQFLNEMPIELIEDLTTGSSWLSYARGSGNAKAAVAALRGETSAAKPKNLYAGKTYNSAEAVAEFFKNKAAGEKGRSDEEGKGRDLSSYANPTPKSSTFDRLKSAGSTPQQKEQRAAASQGINPGNYVRHDKYGRGLVLRREGSGDNAKLTISFPGFGQKKLIEKYANLQKDG
jgi:DNA helicase-2/ATP-dependent DNA helicase PcrA